MTRSFLAGILSLQLVFAQQPQAPVPQSPGQQPQPTTRQPVEAPPPPLARQQGETPAPGTANTSTVFVPGQPLLPRNSAIAPVRQDRMILVRPYLPVEVPQIRTGNAPRLAALVR